MISSLYIRCSVGPDLQRLSAVLQNSGLARIELISGMHVLMYSARKELTTEVLYFFAKKELPAV